MKIIKEAKTDISGNITSEDLELINANSKKKLTQDEIFVFEMILCDNDVDRDYECFNAEALNDLAEMFIGKTGIFDHEWSATGQKARIFKTSVVTDDTKSTVYGEPYTYLKASAYMLREGNEQLISEIEGGIKREVSIGCSMSEALCSICGENIDSQKCGHARGREYNGRTCYATLGGAKDAYEWSFVAVPAQKNAGVIKKFDRIKLPKTLDEYVKYADNAGFNAEYTELKRLAGLGDTYLKKLREEVVRLGVLSDSGLSGDFLEKMLEKMNEQELLGFKKAFEDKVDLMYPPVCQLDRNKSADTSFTQNEFLI